MPHNSCTQITMKIGQPGYAKKCTQESSRSLLDAKVRVAGKNRVPLVPLPVHNTEINMYTTSPAPAGIHYAPFGIHRQTPVL